MGQSALALTDHGTLAGALHHMAACRENQVMPISGCLMRGQTIVTSEGAKSVEDVSVGDMVLTHRGRFRPVLRTMTRSYTGDVYEVVLAKNGGSVKLTEEHPLLVRDRCGIVSWKRPSDVEWQRTERMEHGDVPKERRWTAWVCLPKLQDDRLSELSLLPYVGDGLEWREGRWRSDRRSWSFPSSLTVTAQMARFFGLFAGEGWTLVNNNGTFGLTFALHERHLVDECVVYLRSLGLAPHVYERPKKGSIDVHCCHRPMQSALSSICGRTAANKRVPTFVFSLSPAIRQMFVSGLVDAECRKSPTSSLFRVASRDLAWGFRTLIADLGYWSKVKKSVDVKEGKARTRYDVCYTPNRRHSMTLEDGNYLYRPIKEVVRTTEFVEVFNFEVEEDNSYVSDFVLHNCEIYFRPNRKVQGQAEWRYVYFHMVLLAKDARGWLNLMRLVSESHSSGFYSKPCADLELLRRYHEGLICGTACLGGVLCQRMMDGDSTGVAQWLQELKVIFRDDLFIEIMPSRLPEQVKVNPDLVSVAHDQSIMVAATCDAHTPFEEWTPTQDVLLMIQTNQSLSKREEKRAKGEDVFEFVDPTYYLQSEEEVRENFSGWHPSLSQRTVDESISNTLEIASRCQPFLVGRHDKLPRLDRGRPDGELLRELAFEGLRAIGKDQDPVYVERMEFELHQIDIAQIAAYLLMVRDVVEWAKSDRGLPDKDGKEISGGKVPIMVGPGRGCLCEGSVVWTERGYVSIEEVMVGDVVRTHTGSLRSVENVLEHKVEAEPLLRFRVYGDGGAGVAMTHDHHVLVRRCEREQNKSRLAQGYVYASTTFDIEPDWVRADEVEVGDLLCVPRPRSSSQAPQEFDVGKMMLDVEGVEVTDDEIIEKFTVNYSYDLSIRSVQSDTRVSRGVLQRMVADPGWYDEPRLSDGRRATRSERVRDVVLDHLSKEGVATLSEWSDIVQRESVCFTKTPRFIKVDEDFCFLLGAWASNGWFKSDSPRVVGLAEQRSKVDDTVLRIIRSIWGLDVARLDHAEKDLTQWEIRSRAVRTLLGSVFSSYQYRAQTKHLPPWSIDLEPHLRRSLLAGLWWGDGSTSDRWSYSTTSPELLRQVRDLIWAEGAQASVAIDDRTDDRLEFSNRSLAWRITTTRDFGVPRTQRGAVDDDYIYQRVRSIEDDGPVDRVFDLAVPIDHSFATDSFVVHNSAGGSLVVDCIGITNIDPITWRFQFERFYNVARRGLPDIDVDFPRDRVDEVEEYTKMKFGRDHVLDVVAHQTFGPRASIRRVGMVLDLPFGKVDEACKTIDETDRSPLEEIRVVNQRVDDIANDYPEAWQHMVRIQSQVQNRSEHPAALIITPPTMPVQDVIPMERIGGQGGKMITAWGERAGRGNDLISGYGFMKFDWLRVAELDKQAFACKLIEERTGERIDLDALPIHRDPYAVESEVMEGFGRGLLTGIFQFSQTARGITRKMVPDNGFDVAVVNALIRPGPRGKSDDIHYVERKQGREETVFWHSKLEPYLDYTHGVLCYQEQLTEVVHHLGGLSKVDADNFRKIASKLYRDTEYAIEMMNEWKVPIFEGFKRNGISDEKCDVIWENLLSFSDYSFNLAHAGGYSLLSYRGMWLKIHYPREFFAAFLSKGLPQDKDKKIVQKEQAVREARALGLQILPPDINESGFDYTVVEDGIRLGLGAVKHAGPVGAREVLIRRPPGGYESYEHLERLTEKRTCNVKVKGALVCAGAMDRWGRRDDYTEEKVDELEREYLGVGLSTRFSAASYADVIDPRIHDEAAFDTAHDGDLVCVAGEVVGTKEWQDAKGGLMCFVDMAYNSNEYSVTFFAGMYSRYRELIHSRRPIIIRGTKNVHGGRAGIIPLAPGEDGGRVTDYVQAVDDLARLVRQKPAAT